MCVNLKCTCTSVQFKFSVYGNTQVSKQTNLHILQCSPAIVSGLLSVLPIIYSRLKSPHLMDGKRVPLCIFTVGKNIGGTLFIPFITVEI